MQLTAQVQYENSTRIRYILYILERTMYPEYNVQCTQCTLYCVHIACVYYAICTAQNTLSSCLKIAKVYALLRIPVTCNVTWRCTLSRGAVSRTEL